MVTYIFNKSFLVWFCFVNLFNIID